VKNKRWRIKLSEAVKFRDGVANDAQPVPAPKKYRLPPHIPDLLAD
jgi:hypothetical protein